jgi:eukaryotic-like serine/threonine-protein kinase
LAEELIAAFSGVKGLRVIPRTTAFQFKGKSGDVRAIGRQLDVQAVLDGGVERDGEHLRIRLALTRVSDGQTLWSHSYDRAAQDVFATEDEVATSVVHALFPKDQRSVDLLPLNGTKSIEAQNLYLKANFVQQTRYKNEDALALYRRAAELDPNYPQAWAGLAFCYLELGYGYQRYPKDVLPLAVQAVQRALQLNPRLALSHAIQGYLDVTYLRDWNAARREIETAISLDPNNGESHHWMSHYWVSLGRFKEAEDESRRALECDPLNFGIGAHQAWVKYEQGLFPEAIHAAEDTLRLEPLHVPTSWYRIRTYEESGQMKEAIAIRRRLGWGLADELELGFRQNGATGYWRVFKEDLLRRRNAGPGLVRPTEIAWVHAHLGERLRALEWLEQAVEERDPWTIYMKVEPPFTGLRSDPRFQRIARAAGLP